VETAFLHGKLEQQIYMECPHGLESQPDEVLLLQQTIYGLVQSAREYFKKFIHVLKNIGFIGGTIDPCLMLRRNKSGIVYIAIYVDDCLLMGDRPAVDKAIEDIQKGGFKIKLEDTMGDYLSCNIKFNKDRTKAWLGQPHQVKKLEAQFKDLVKGMTTYKTPGTPGYNIIRPGTDDPKLSPEDQKTYRSGCGMLLYLVKHSRPDIANVARELSKCMDQANAGAYKELKRVIKFVLDTKSFGLKIEPIKEKEDGLWHIMCYCDSDYAGDPATRKSVSGFIIFLMNVPIMWRSKSQGCVTLSSSEAEYISLSEAAKEIRFVYQLMRTMSINVKTPIIVRVDNMGAIFMSENISTSNRSRHVDIRYRFVNDMCAEGFLKIIFVKTKDNVSDGFTKNVNGDTYNSHIDEFIAEGQEYSALMMDVPLEGY